MTNTLFYAAENLKGEDIPAVKFTTFRALMKKIHFNAVDDKVYLLTYEYNLQGKYPQPAITDNEIIITTNKETIKFHLYFICEKKTEWGNRITSRKIFLQVYNSYEEAYQVALMMKEGMSEIAYTC